MLHNHRNHHKKTRESHFCRWSFTPLLSKFAVSLLLVAFALMFDNSQASVASSVSTAAKAKALTTIADEENSCDGIKIVFSDVDGTLVHYPTKEKVDNKNNNNNKNNRLLKLPSSSTGQVGVISAKTLSLVDEIRTKNNVKFVMISGMRTSTLLQRLPFLPRADAYCSENGGRIFYPIEDNSNGIKSENTINDSYSDRDSDRDVFWVHPKRYKHESDNSNDKTRSGGDPHNQHQPFAIREDTTWRKKMTAAMGGNSFGSFSLRDIYEARDDPASTSLPLNERDGLLWDFARDLIHTKGFVLDTKGYSTCFRVNRKQQTSREIAETPPGLISALLDNPPWNNHHHNQGSPSSSIASSVNLSCVDFYPSCSGKKNCCLYLASKFFPKDCEETSERNDVPATDGGDSNTSSAGEDFLSKHAVCMCDDDNDLEMALACEHAYLPDIASDSMRDTIFEFPDHFTTTFRSGTVLESTEEYNETRIVETDASDLALSIIWARTNMEPDVK